MTPMRRRPGLYVHIPYCSEICPYCDFAVRRGNSTSGGPWVDALLAEARGLRSSALLPEAPDLASALTELSGQTFDTLYLGGGTPSILALEDLSRLLDGLRHTFELAASCRIFLEANPEDVEPRSLEGWRRLGVSTLSLGVQSLDDRDLAFLGRRHRAKDAEKAVRQARPFAFDTVSVDMIYGLPGQESSSWQRQLDRALELGADHLSLYELEIHPRTAFGRQHAKGELVPLGDEERAELFLATHQRMESAGWLGYEVSNFARQAAHISQHNRKYWHHVPYLGLGPSAHSLVIEGPTNRTEPRPAESATEGPALGELWRYWNEPAEPRWRRHIAEGISPAAGWERLSPAALALEAAMLGLRHREGLDLGRLRQRFGLDLEADNGERFEAWQRCGWIERRKQTLVPTPQGMALADRLATEIELPKSGPTSGSTGPGRPG